MIMLCISPETNDRIMHVLDYCSINTTLNRLIKKSLYSWHIYGGRSRRFD